MNRAKQEGIPFRFSTENRQSYEVFLPPTFFHLMSGLFRNMGRHHILRFINEILEKNRFVWDEQMIKDLINQIQEENISIIIVNKKDYHKLERIKQTPLNKFAVVYQGDLYTLSDKNINLRSLKLLQQNHSNTQIAILNTKDEQPHPEEVKVLDLKIVYFDN